MIPTPPGRRGTRKAPSIPAGLPPEYRAFFEQVYAQTSRSIYAIDEWFHNNVQAATTAQQLTRIQNAGIDGWVAPRDGWVWTLWGKITPARTAGTLTINVFKNGAQLGTLSAVIDGVNTTYKASQAIGTESMPFKAGDQLDIRLTTDGAWAPNTADIIAGIEVEL
jgi:hypothetical protein